MSCEHYKDALIEAAASGAMPQGELRAHLTACASCRAALAEEQSLFAAIDSGVHATANSEVPVSLLPRVRASLNEGALSRRNWLPRLVFASASVALILLFLLLLRPHHGTPEDVATQNPITIPTPLPHETNINPQKISPKDTEIAVVAPRHARAPQNSTVHQATASGNPEVLILPDEREGFARFVAVLNERRNVAATLLGHAPEKKDAVISVDPLQIPDIEIKLLEGAETTTPDAAGEKR